MSQKSSKPGHVESHDSSQEEIQRLKEALGKTQTRLKVLSKKLERERSERLALLEDNEGERVSGHETSGDQISAQQWRDRAAEAERRAEEAKRSAEEAEQVTREVHIQVIQRGMERIFAEITGDVRSESVPKDEASEGEDSDKQDEYGDLASEGEEAEYQSHQSPQVSEDVDDDDDDEEESSTHEPAQEIIEEEYAARQAYNTSSRTYQGAEKSGLSLPRYEQDTRSSLEYDHEVDASKPRVCIPETVDSPQQLSTGDLKGTSPQPSPLPLPSMLSQPQQHQSFPHRVRKSTQPSDQHAPSAKDNGKISNVASPLGKLGDMLEALPTLSGSSKRMKQNFPNLPKGSSQIPGIPTESTAPPLEKRATPVPRVQMAPWDL